MHPQFRGNTPIKRPDPSTLPTFNAPIPVLKRKSRGCRRLEESRAIEKSVLPHVWRFDFSRLEPVHKEAEGEHHQLESVYDDLETATY